MIATVVICTLTYSGWFPPFTDGKDDEHYVVRSVVRCSQLQREREADWARATPLPIADARIQCGPCFEDCTIDSKAMYKRDEDFLRSNLQESGHD